MTDVPKIVWTRKEALACALCWAEFSAPEGRPDSPEQYWLGITAKSRQECRKIVKDRHLLAVAMRRAAALPAPNSLTDEQIKALGEAIGLKARHRVWNILQVLYRYFLPKEWSDADRAEVARAMEAGETL